MTAGMRGALVALVVLTGLGVGWRYRRNRPPRTPSASGSASADAATSPANADSSWPGPLATLRPPTPHAPAGWSRKRIFLDAGHGAEDNAGNRSCFCVDEQDFTLRVAEHVARRFAADGWFETRLSRSGKERIGYRERVLAAVEWQAHAFVSIHSDVRGQGQPWQPKPGLECLQSRAHPGFSVLWSDQASALLGSERLGLARAVAQEMLALGLPAYDGRTYLSDYAAHPGAAGVFVDRHPEPQRIFVLYAPTMPSIIIETHHALDDREAMRWDQPATLDAFAAALEQALLNALSP